MHKIAYIVSTLKKSGPTNQLSYILKNLDKTKFELVLITLSPEPKDSMLEKFKKLKIKYIPLNLTRMEGFYKAKSKLLKILKEENIDLIHTQGIRADILSAKYLKGYHRVSTLRNYPWDDYPMKFGKFKGYLMAKNHIKATQKIENSIACSESISKIYRKNEHIDVSYIQNGVDISLFKEIEGKHEIRKKLKIPLDKIVYISVGSLIPRKDPKLIIDSFKKLKDPEKRILIFLGDGFLKEECNVLINESNNIRLMGNVDNVKEYLQGSDYFVSASLSEGLPNTVIEAMACGLPCVLSNIAPHEEILKINDGAGIIFKQKNLEDLIEKIYKIENSNYEEMRKASKEIIENQLNSIIMVKKYQNKYLEILGEKNG